VVKQEWTPPQVGLVIRQEDVYIGPGEKTKAIHNGIPGVPNLGLLCYAITALHMIRRYSLGRLLTQETAALAVAENVVRHGMACNAL